MKENEKEEQVKKVREKLAEVIDFCGKLTKVEGTLEGIEHFKKTKDLLEDAQKEFNAQLFAILMFGPLKAGKSTLTNLLAGEYVSPTGFGAETTLRPSLIIKGRNKNRSIDVYVAKDTKDNPEELFRLVINVLRGFSDFSEIQNKVRKKSVPWSKDNLIAQLTKDLDPEPLITVLNVPGGGLVTEHTALIDMPGLDGAKSNWEDSPVHKWVLEKADFLIFVQSSMAALNESTSGYLKEVYINSKKPPLYLVQNVMEAKHWRGKEYMERESSDQSRKAKAHVLNLIGSTEDLPSTPINLGKAYDAWDEEEQYGNLAVGSGFHEFEDTLQDILSSKREIIKQENAVREVGAAVERCKTIFDTTRDELDRREKECDNNINKRQKLKKTVNDVLNLITDGAISDPLGDYLKELIGQWVSECEEDHLTALGDGSNPKKGVCKQKVDEAINDINRFYGKKLKDKEIKSKVCNLAKGCLDKIWGDQRQELNTSLKDLGKAPLDEGEPFEKQIKIDDEVTFASRGSPCQDKIQEKLSQFGLFNNKDNASELWKTLKKEHKLFAENLQESMARNISKQFDDWIKYTYKVKLKADIESKVDGKIRENDNKKKIIDSTRGYIGALESMCDELKKRVEKVQMEEDLLASASEE